MALERFKEEFSLFRFKSLFGLNLHEYMEPRLANVTKWASKKVGEQMLSEIDRYDSCHVVYALLIAFESMPIDVIYLLPEYLLSNDQAVACTAFNLLSRTPKEWVSEEVCLKLKEIERTDATFAPLLKKMNRR